MSARAGLRMRRPMRLRSRGSRSAGQALAEFSLVIPVALLFMVGLIVLGIGVFYQEQLANAAREGARYAGIHSSTAQCPTVSWLDPTLANQSQSYYRCDGPAEHWPNMVRHARNAAWALDRSQMYLSACWSGYRDAAGAHDAPPVDPGTLTPNTFFNCTIAGVDPLRNASALPCPAPATSPSDDQASNLASATHGTNRVTVYMCYRWTPPLAGFLLIPSTITMRAVVGEAVERQQ